ncbi:hypothetical protein [Albirhodobacter sp. R86504]|uniref:hypothetical protein n=1 Tax=Albirhodobacter sp. R86504 TaxID=3093848 RepID=UPI00366DF616
MNLNRISNMVINIVMRKMINFGVNKGMSAVSKRNRRADTPDAAQDRPMTAQEAKIANDAKEAAKRARKAARVAGRF